MPARTRSRAKFDFRGRPFVWWVDGDRWLRICSFDKRFVVAVPLGIEGDGPWPVVGVIGSEFPGIDAHEPRPVWLIGPTLPKESLGGWVDAVLTWAFEADRPLTDHVRALFAPMGAAARAAIPHLPPDAPG